MTTPTTRSRLSARKRTTLILAALAIGVAGAATATCVTHSVRAETDRQCSLAIDDWNAAAGAARAPLAKVEPTLRAMSTTRMNPDGVVEPYLDPSAPEGASIRPYELESNQGQFRSLLDEQASLLWASGFAGPCESRADATRISGRAAEARAGAARLDLVIAAIEGRVHEFEGVSL